jgi:excisionase family DNA binding protein
MTEKEEKVKRDEKNAIVITIPFNELEDVIKTWIRECQSNTPDIQLINQKRYLTRKEAANALHVSLVTLGSYIKSGILPANQIGTRILIPEEALHESLRKVPTKSKKLNS